MLKKSINMPLKIEYNIVSDKVIKAFLRENIELKSGVYNYNEYSLLLIQLFNIHTISFLKSPLGLPPQLPP